MDHVHEELLFTSCLSHQAEARLISPAGDAAQRVGVYQVIKPVGNVLSAKGLAQIAPVTSFIASFTSIAETAEQKAELMHYVFALCESAVLSADAAR